MAAPPVHYATAAPSTLRGMAGVRVALQRVTLELPTPPAAELHGHTEMLLDVLEAVADGVLRLHGLGLAVAYTRLRALGSGDESSSAPAIAYEPDEVVALYCGAPLAPGKYVLVLRYTGQVQNNGRKKCGVFPMHYPVGATWALGYATQCEPCDARRVFPCIDEPNTRSAFQLSLIASPAFTAVSNTPLERKEALLVSDGATALAQGAAEVLTVATSHDEAIRHYNENGLAVCHTNEVPTLPGARTLTRWTFGPTAPMSPYLVAFVLAEFDEYSADAPLLRGPVPVQVLTHVGRREAGQYALDHTMRTLQFYEEKIGVAFAWPKLSVVAMDDAPMLGEENWGCITLHADYLHVDKSTSFRRVQRITRLVAHEVGHMWFGNLVSIRSWEALWLKEGFARFLEYCYVDTVEPAWAYWEHFLVAIFSEAMARDARSTTHPIQSVVGPARKVSHVFDVIRHVSFYALIVGLLIADAHSYGKGASVIRMLFAYLTPAVGWATIARLIKEAQGTSITAEDLWKAFAATSDLDVPAIVHTWINYSHYPIVTVKVVAHSETATSLELEQRVAIENGQHIDSRALRDDESGLSQYLIPLIYKSSTGVVERTVMRQSVAKLDVKHAQAPAWIKLNWENAGFYRVLYPSEMMVQLIAAGARGELPVLDHIGLLLDMIFFVMNGIAPCETLVQLVVSFQDCTSPNAWPVVITELRAWLDLCKDAGAFAIVAAFICRLCEPLAASLGWFAPSFTNEELQVEVLALLEDVGSRAWEEAAHTTEAPSPACWLTWQAARLASGDASQCDALVPRLRVWHFFDAAIPFLQWRAEPTDIIMDAILGSCVPQRSCAWFVANARLRTALWSTILNRLAEQSDNETLPDDHTERADLLVKWFQKMVALADALHAPDRGVMLAEMQALWDERSDDINDAKVHADFEKFAKQRASPERPSNVQDLLAALRVSLA